MVSPMPKVDPTLVGRLLQSDANIVDEERMVAVVHDTGNIGCGSMTKGGRYSATLYTTETVRAHAHELIKLCDVLDGKVTMDELRAAEADEEE